MKLILSLKMFLACLTVGLVCAFASALASHRVESRVEGRNVMESSSEQQNDLQPNAKLSPSQVVKIQLDALQKNDQPTPDAGIRTAFRFASPANREMTGPVERFIPLVKNPLYRPLLNHRRAEQDAPRVEGDTAQQRVTVTDKDGRRAVYLFTLSKQREAPYANCWMTDGVERIENERNTPDDRRIAQGNGHLRGV